MLDRFQADSCTLDKSHFKLASHWIPNDPGATHGTFA